MVLFFFCNLAAEAQVSARLTVQSGGHVDFNFNSIRKYKDGITYADWTTFAVSFTDAISPSSEQWKLEFRASTPDIPGDGGNSLNLNTLELTAANGGGSGIANYYGPVALSNTNQLLVDSGPLGDENVNLVRITYQCGTNPVNRLLGKAPDYYVVDIIFTLSAQ